MVAMDVEDPHNVASILMTTHGEIPVDNQGHVRTFELSKDMGVDNIYYVSAVNLASDAVNYGVRQVQERSALELLQLYTKPPHHPTLHDILNALKRPRNLDLTNTISGCRRKEACSRYSDTLSFYGRHHSGRRAAELGMKQNNYDAAQYMKQVMGEEQWQKVDEWKKEEAALRAQKNDQEADKVAARIAQLKQDVLDGRLKGYGPWSVAHLNLASGESGKFVNKEFVVVLSDEINDKGERICAPLDNNALLLLPESCGGVPCARQLIGNFKEHKSPGSFDQEGHSDYLQQIIADGKVPVAVAKGIFDGQNNCGNIVSDSGRSLLETMVDGQVGSVARLEGKGPKGCVQVRTTMECLIRNAVKAYRDKTGDEAARLEALVIVDLTCQVYKDEDGDFLELADNPGGEGAYWRKVRETALDTTRSCTPLRRTLTDAAQVLANKKRKAEDDTEWETDTKPQGKPSSPMPGMRKTFRIDDVPDEKKAAPMSPMDGVELTTGGGTRRRRRTRGRKTRGRKTRGRKTRGRKTRGRKTRGRKTRRHKKDRTQRKTRRRR